MTNSAKNEKAKPAAATSPDSSENKTVANPTIEEALGAVTWLLSRSVLHKHLFVTDFEWLILPPLQLTQFRIFRDDKRPVGFVSWAFIDAATEERLLQGVTKLAPKDWRSGDKLWIVDVVAPFGGAAKMLEELDRRLFKDKEAKVLRPKIGERGLEGRNLKTVLEELKTAEAKASSDSQTLP